MMGSIHNDLHSWAARARARGHSTIEIDVDFADKASELIVSQAAEIERVKSERWIGDDELSESAVMSDPNRYIECGGCGADHPSQRCIGCLHSFFDGDWPTKWAVSIGAVQVAEIREFVLDWLPSDAAGDDFKARLICKLDLLNTTERR